MDFDGKVKNYGPVDISTIRKKVQGLAPRAWKKDSAGRKNLAGSRPGNALFIITDTPDKDTWKSYEGMLNGMIHVFLGGGWNLLNKPTMELIKNHVMPAYSGCLPIKVQYAELPPGKTIEPHRDGGILAEIHRLHVPLITHSGVKFFIENEQFFLEEGHLYELNNVKSHAVRNTSNVMRIHLLIDMIPKEKSDVLYHSKAGSLNNGKNFNEFFDA